MKKIIFLLSLILITNASNAQTCISNSPGGAKNFLCCSLMVVQVPGSYFTVGPDAVFSGNISASTFAGSWAGAAIPQSKGGTGYSSFSAALSANGLTPGTALSYSDTNVVVPSMGLLKDSLVVHRAFINTKLSKSDTTNKWMRLGSAYTKLQSDSIKLTITKTSISLGNVDNTRDSSKPISIATQTALNGKLSAEVDGSITNEIQSISRTNGTISLSLSGRSIHLPDSSATNEIELPSQSTNAGRVLITNGTSVSWGKRQETYTGATVAAGTYTVTYTTAYGTTPNVQFQINGGTNKQTILLTSSTTTGFTVYVQLRADVLGLLPSYSNVSGAVVDMLVTEK